MTAAEYGGSVGNALQTCAAWFEGGSADPVILDLHGMRLAVAVHRHGDTSCSDLFDRVGQRLSGREIHIGLDGLGQSVGYGCGDSHRERRTPG